mmetsp:Transcript_55318/g.118956  ORF Transcript_55318/g.118956 Transcript_55318/m.118956 type:complete len:1010 (+) Transcript_55318:71-3100(+)
MAGGKFRQREVPWCTVFLVTAAMTCHTCVLVGNFKTAGVMHDLGSSTFGWSKVGLGLARSFEKELDFLMTEVSEQLLDALNHSTAVRQALDVFVSLVGNETDQAVQTHSGATLLQIQGGNISESLTKGLGPLVLGAIEELLDDQMANLNKLLDMLLVKIKPALTQVGQWILKFGDKILAGIESFSNTLDKVQKMYDEVMAELSGNGGGEDDMLHETFGLFDVSHTGSVTVQDLQDVGTLYSINALSGEKPAELVSKYDANGDSQLNRAELKLLVNDESIPNSMATVLRTYSRKLSEVAGNVAAARMRDEVSLTVVSYFQLVCAKNMTKVGWVSDALGNGSLPIEFTSAVMAQLCLTEGDPNALTTADVGAIVIGKMYELHAEHTLEAVDLMADTKYWSTNGFNPLDQPRCMKRVTEWVTEAKANMTSAGLLQAEGAMSSEVLAAMPAMAERLAEESLRVHLLDRQACRAKEVKRLFASETQVSLLRHLTGRSEPTGVGMSSSTERALNAGQPAKPETIVFAQYLSANATATAQRLQDMSFDYSKQSSSALDGFATQIQGMAKKVQNFIQMMMKWATPAGIQKLEDMVHKFATDALEDVKNAVLHVIEGLVNTSMPMIADAVMEGTEKVGEQIGETIGQLVGNTLSDALSEPLGDIMGDILNNTELGKQWGDQLGPMVTDIVVEKAGEPLGDLVTDVLDSAIEKALGAATTAVASATGQTTPSLLEADESYYDSTMVGFEVPPAWDNVVSTLTSLDNLLPAAAETLKFARKEVSKAASNMDSIFDVFSVKGPQIFDLVAKLWKILWVLYFFFITPLTCMILFYGLWSGGFFGGPQPIITDDDAEPPKTCMERLRCCCSACCVCCSRYHDTQFCFWSAIILAQVLVLVVFIISIVLSIVAGIKVFITAGCSQVYVLADPQVCTSAMGTLREFLGTFFVKDAVEELSGVCPSNNLLTCALISKNMKQSVILTTVFSFLAAIFSLQMLIESAVLHEQARYRRMYNTKALEDVI